MSFNQIVENQRAFFKSGATRNYEFRRHQLLKLRKILETHADAINTAVQKDLRRDKRMTQIVEVNSALTEVNYFLKNLKEWMKPEYVEKTLANILDTALVVREPFGVCLLIPTWNYPVLMIFYPLIAMLAAGNTVVIKASEVSQFTSALLAQLLENAFEKVTENMQDVPELTDFDNVVAIVQGDAAVATEVLREHFDKIMYTGNSSIGRIIMEAAAKNVTPVLLELGGKCPVIVESDADLEVTAKRIVWGKCFNSGQTCIAPDYIITTLAVKAKLVELIRKTFLEFYGNSVKQSHDYDRIISERHFDRLAGLISSTKGLILYKGGEADRSDLFIPPTLVDCGLDDALMKDEIFGPILPIITVNSAINDGIDLINKGPSPLTSYIFTKDSKKVNRLINETQSGSVLVNDVIMHYGVDTLPFGGIGNSGMGSYRGKYGFIEFSHAKSVLIRGFVGDGLARARYPPLSDKSYRQLAFLLARRTLPKWLNWLRPSFPSLILGIALGIFLQRSKRIPLPF